MITVLFFSCGKQLCKDSNCGPYGTCSYGECICDSQHEHDGDGSCNDTIFCATMDCGHGTCNDLTNTCDCDFYFENAPDHSCTIRYRDKFLGNWLGTHITSAGDTVGPYVMTFSAGTLNDAQVKITNFGNFSCSSTGSGLEVTGSTANTTTIGFFQPVCTGYSSVGGTITLIDNTHFTADINVFQLSTSTHFSGVFTKQ